MIRMIIIPTTIRNKQNSAKQYNKLYSKFNKLTVDPIFTEITKRNTYLLDTCDVIPRTPGRSIVGMSGPPE